MCLKVSIIVEHDTQSYQPIWGKEYMVDNTPCWSPNTLSFTYFRMWAKVYWKDGGNCKQGDRFYHVWVQFSPLDKKTKCFPYAYFVLHMFLDTFYGYLLFGIKYHSYASPCILYRHWWELAMAWLSLNGVVKLFLNCLAVWFGLV